MSTERLGEAETRAVAGEVDPRLVEDSILLPLRFSGIDRDFFLVEEVRDSAGSREAAGISLKPFAGGNDGREVSGVVR